MKLKVKVVNAAGEERVLFEKRLPFAGEAGVNAPDVSAILKKTADGVKSGYAKVRKEAAGAKAGYERVRENVADAAKAGYAKVREGAAGAAKAGTAWVREEAAGAKAGYERVRENVADAAKAGYAKVREGAAGAAKVGSAWVREEAAGAKAGYERVRENVADAAKAGYAKVREGAAALRARRNRKVKEDPDDQSAQAQAAQEEPSGQAQAAQEEQEAPSEQSGQAQAEASEQTAQTGQTAIPSILKKTAEGLKNGYARVCEDVAAVRARDPAAKSDLEVLLLYSGLHAVLAYRLAHALNERGMELPARAISQGAKFFTGVEIHPAAKIGKNLFIDHGTGVVIGETSVIGDDCTIYQGATLGGTGKETGKRHPTVGNGVMIGTGAKILGPVKIGDHSKIAAGAVVLKDIPDHCTAVGIPARIVKQNDERVEDLDQIHIPDPVEKEFAKLREEIEELKTNSQFAIRNSQL